jgi:phage virion morphogenesis protein
MLIQITIDDAGVKAELGRLAGRLGNLTPAMRSIGEIVRTSVERNFAASGRPEKWKISKRVQEKGGQTLSDTGRLRRSFTVRAYPDRAEVGTNVKYAAIHQFGGIISAKNRPYLKFKIGDRWVSKKSIIIPARPFLMVQDEDWGKMQRYLEKYLVEGNA